MQQPKDRPSIESPTGLDLKPQPAKPIRCSKRVSAVIIVIGVLVLSILVYGGLKRMKKQQIAAQQAGVPTGVAPATQAGKEFSTATPPGNAPYTAAVNSGVRPAVAPQLVPPKSPEASCGADPRSGQAYRFNPDTGQPCGSNAQPIGGSPVLSQGTGQTVQAQPVQQMQMLQQPQRSPQQEAMLSAFKRQQAAMLAPTGVSLTAGPGQASANEAGTAPFPPDVTAPMAALKPTRAMLPSGEPRGLVGSSREAFLAQSRPENNDYLPSTREPELSPYEVKAGWEIPAVLEQALNSDLPGQLKALVMSNVYDSATGQYLLIPQGCRLIGKYDSHVSYGQNGVQVAWSRILFPDGSSMDLDGMQGLDSHGNAGLRDTVDHHYKRLFGMTALSSIFSAGFAISQYRNQSVLSTASPGQMASSAMAGDAQNTTGQITRQNLNVPPTIKVPAGYKFTVRVDRDMFFDAPYAPMEHAASSKQGLGVSANVVNQQGNFPR